MLWKWAGDCPVFRRDSEMFGNQGKPCPRNKLWRRRRCGIERRQCGAGDTQRGSPRSLRFALLHAWHLRADFPNGSPGFATGRSIPMKAGMGTRPSARTCLGTGTWPAILIRRSRFRCGRFWSGCCFFYRRTVEAARGLAVACFSCNLALSYLLLRAAEAPPAWRSAVYPGGHKSLPLLL